MTFGPNLLPGDGGAWLDGAWLPEAEADALLGELMGGLDWRQEHARFGSREVPLPRLTAWYGDVGYRYSGVYHPARGWPERLADLRDSLPLDMGVLAGQVGGPPNSVLANLYRDGRDSVAWHSDDEPVLGPAPSIWSVSLGSGRRFLLRHRQGRQLVELELTHGSILVMAGACQRCWQHCVPKTSRPVGPRVNLTFRCTAPPGPAS
ncbi:MAG: alpha-ketoglutarate-dependent dioxygenase AlkB family protein [Acidimicrobiales bacterium]